MNANANANVNVNVNVNMSGDGGWERWMDEEVGKNNPSDFSLRLWPVM